MKRESKQQKAIKAIRDVASQSVYHGNGKPVDPDLIKLRLDYILLKIGQTWPGL